MRVRLIKKKSIEQFALLHSRSRNAFRLWLSILIRAEWYEPNDILSTYGSADLLGNGTDRVVFDIAGNHYRMICKYHFGLTKIHLYIKWIGTHADYTRLCNRNEQFLINIY